MTPGGMQLPEEVFYAVRRPPEGGAREMRLVPAIHWYECGHHTDIGAAMMQQEKIP
jgi:hypothetical protein